MNFLLLLFLSTLRDLDNLLNSNSQNQISSANQQKARYDNYALYSIKFQNDSERLYFENRINANQNYDLWKTSSREIHIMVSPNNLIEFQRISIAERLTANVLIPNVQRLIDQEEKDLRKPSSSNFDWTRYHTLEEINTWVRDVLSLYPNVTQSIVIGNSFEGRTIYGIKISYKSGNPGIFIESNIHAREWITSATATWIINELLTSNQTEFRYLAENYDWYIVPVLNVDGFVYSHERDRLWRKTRRPNPSRRECVGVDGNRNYNSHWMQNNGAASDPCDETFGGAFPFSEPETRALASYVQSIKDRINILLAFHSYGQKLLSPFGYTKSRKPDNYDDLMQVANAFSRIVSTLPYGTQYEAGTTSDLLYIASGDTSDWAYDQGIRLSYTIEFRDQGQYGFILPSTYIIPNSEEVLNGIFAMLSEADFLGYMDLPNDASNL